MTDVLEALHRSGTTAGVRERLLPFDDYFALVGLGEHLRLERRYAE